MAREDAKQLRTGEARFAAYLDGITAALGHASRVAPARAYCTGLLLPGERKSVEPMAARIEPERVQAAHQSMHHIVAKAEWDDTAVLGAARRQVLPVLERHGPIACWTVDDTGFPKQGKHSAGVAWQCLRPVGQAGQPPGGGEPVGGQRSCQPAGRLSPLLARGLGGGYGATREGGVPAAGGTVPSRAAAMAAATAAVRGRRQCSGFSAICLSSDSGNPSLRTASTQATPPRRSPIRRHP